MAHFILKLVRKYRNKIIFYTNEAFKTVFYAYGTETSTIFLCCILFTYFILYSVYLEIKLVYCNMLGRKMVSLNLVFKICIILFNSESMLKINKIP